MVHRLKDELQTQRGVQGALWMNSREYRSNEKKNEESGLQYDKPNTKKKIKSDTSPPDSAQTVKRNNSHYAYMTNFQGSAISAKTSKQAILNL